MTLIVIVCVREGIVISSDSREMANATLHDDEGPYKGVPKNISIVHSDSTSKIFLAPNNIGIAQHNASEIDGVPVSEYIESFISQKLVDGKTEIDEIPSMLIDHFKGVAKKPAIFFYACGYKRSGDGKVDPQIWHIDLQHAKFERANPPNTFGASYAGESDIIMRLTKPVATLTKEGKVETKFEHWPIQWQSLPLQDAIDYAMFAIRVTAGMMRFQIRSKSVGGPTDVLVIKPKEAIWFEKKELNAGDLHKRP